MVHGREERGRVKRGAFGFPSHEPFLQSLIELERACILASADRAGQQAQPFNRLRAAQQILGRGYWSRQAAPSCLASVDRTSARAPRLPAKPTPGARRRDDRARSPPSSGAADANPEVWGTAQRRDRISGANLDRMTEWSSLEDFVERHRRLFVLTGGAAARTRAFPTIATASWKRGRRCRRAEGLRKARPSFHNSVNGVSVERIGGLVIVACRGASPSDASRRSAG
jgi:hypothetical protein